MDLAPMSCLPCLLLAVGPSDSRPGPAAADRREEPPLLRWAGRIARGVGPEDTAYEHSTGPVRWKGVGGATEYVSRTDCSGFVNALFRRAYGLTGRDLHDWLGTERPLAKAYYRAIVEGNGFRRIVHVRDVRPGDLIAVRYPRGDPDNAGHNSGHVMLVAARPVRREPTPPLLDGAEQWEVAVIDQAMSGHGPGDTRHRRGGDRTGLGEGALRLYTAGGAVAGYSWSTRRASRLYRPGERDLAISRYAPPTR